MYTNKFQATRKLYRKTVTKPCLIPRESIVVCTKLSAKVTTGNLAIGFFVVVVVVVVCF